MWAGFSAFCDECVGVGAEKVGAVVMEPVIGRIRDMKIRAERLGLEADPETAEEIRENLSQTWRMVEERAI